MFGWLTISLFILASGWLVISLWRERAYRHGALTQKIEPEPGEKTSFKP